jgi:hypothetical protein
MTDEEAAEAGAILTRLSPRAKFDRVPSWVGSGDLLLTSTDDGIVAIAPPSTSLGPSEGELIGEWKVGWFEADEEGADLDAGPTSQSPVELRDLTPLENARPFLLAQHTATVRYAALVESKATGEMANRARARLTSMEAEWPEIFGEEKWPLAPSPTPEAGGRSFSDVLQAAGQRVVAMFFGQEAGLAGVHGPGSSGDDQPGSQRLIFGPGITMISTGAGEELVIDLAILTQTHPELAGPAYEAYLVDGDRILANVKLEQPPEPTRVRVDLSSVSNIYGLRVGVTALDDR